MGDQQRANLRRAAWKNNESRSSQERDATEDEAKHKANNPGQKPYASGGEC